MRPTGVLSESHGLPPGEALVSWATPRDRGPAGTLGFVASLSGRPIPRELIPLAGAPGSRVPMHLSDLGLEQTPSATLSVRAVDAAGNLGPEASTTVHFPERPAVAAVLPGSAPEILHLASSTPLPSLGGAEIAVVDELDKIHPRTGAMIPRQSLDYLRSNHLWNAVARRIDLHAARNEYAGFQVVMQGKRLGPDPEFRPELTFRGAAGPLVQVGYGRYHPVPTPDGPLPDPIVPLGVAAPGGTDESADGTSSRSLHVELYVPHDMPAGTHQGTLTLKAGGDRLELAVVLKVWDFTLPDHLSFLPEMNCYGLPDNERDYYRLAHRHRTVLNRLTYNQNGRVQEGCAPRWDGRRLDWTGWDQRFGPLLDGSAFRDLPRKGVPVECFYLPLHENWPSPMEGNYNGNYWADQAFPDSYRRAFVSASRQMAEHMLARRYTETLFHGFLNNKNNFKQGGWSRGSSPWLLDEPASFQDFWALRYFGRAFHEGVNQARPVVTKAQAAASRAQAAAPRTQAAAAATRAQAAAAATRAQTAAPRTQAAAPRAEAAAPRAEAAGFPRMVFRIDDSRPQWRRDALDGLVDYHVVGSALRQYPRLVLERKRRFGEIVVEYGGTNALQGSNLQPVGWSLDAWSLGIDGVLPWQTIGTERSWQQADELALFYPLPRWSRSRPGCRQRRTWRGSVHPAEGLSPRPAGRRVPDPLVAAGRVATGAGRPARACGTASRRHAPGHRDRGRRGCRQDRLLGPASAGSLGPPDAHRRGPVAGSSASPRPAR